MKSYKIKTVLNRLKNDKNFTFLLKASSFNVVTKILGTALGVLASFLIARTYGAGLVGIVATITSISTLLSLLALLGNQTLIVKVIPEHIEKYGHAVAKRVYNRLLFITLFFTVVTIALWNFIEFTTPLTLLKGLDQHALLITAVIAFSTFKRLNTRALRALGDYKIYSYFELMPTVLLAILITISIFLKIPEDIFQYIYFLPYIILCGLSFYFVHKTFSANLKKTTFQDQTLINLPTKRSLIQASFPMLGIAMSTAIIANFDILMLNHFTIPSTVGIYAVYAKITIISSLATQTINSMFAPTVSKLYSANKIKELESFSKKATLLSFSMSILVTSLFLLVHKPFLGLYGQEFLHELPTLYVLILTTVVSSFFGPVGIYLNMTGHQSSFFRIILLGVFINIILNTLMIPFWGAVGAAVASLICTVTWNILATRKILKEFKFTIVWSRGLFS